MGKLVDLTGQKFSRLTVLKFIETNKLKKTVWLCKCDCGNETLVVSNNLKSGITKSCGCLKKENLNTKTHGKRNTRLYRIYAHMKERCYKPYANCYKYYGEKGIKICDEWLYNFQTFYDWAMNNGYRDDLTLDRIDVNGDYEPSNCRWVSMKEQNNNKRNNHLITYNGETKTLKQWAEELSINYSTLYQRVYVRKWGIPKSFNVK